MSLKRKRAGGLLCLATLAFACARVEGTGRKQLLLTTPQSENRMGEQVYRQILAQAGYDPKEAVAFWERFGARKTPSLDFLSTHPGGPERIRQLREDLPAALELYERSPRYGSGETLPQRYLVPAGKDGQ
jgi:predicted Zn-dependent protease